MLLWSWNRKDKKSCRKYKPSAWRYLLQETMSPWLTTIAFEHIFIREKDRVESWQKKKKKLGHINKKTQKNNTW